MKRKKIILIVLIVLMNISFLSATSLKTLVDKSIKTSDQITNLTLNREYSMLTLEVSELEAEPMISSSVDFSTPASDTYILNGGTSNILTVVLPGEITPTSENSVSDTTTIAVNGGLTYIPNNSSGDDLDSNASLTVSHNFLMGDYTNNKKDLNNQLTLISANQTYESGLIDFKKNVYSYVSNIISNEKSQRDLEKKIKDQQKVIDDALKLNQISTDSIYYQQYILVLNSYLDALENIQIQRDSLSDNFKQYTGIEYQNVDEIRDPNLDISNSIDDSLSVQLAQLNVNLKQEAIDQVEREVTQSYVKGLAQIAKPYSTSSTNDMSLALQATYNANNVSFYAGTNLNLTLSSFEVEPSVQIGGSWNNDTTTEGDIIQNKIRGNELISAQLALNSAKQSKQLSYLTLNTQIINWKSQFKQLIDNIKFKEDSLELNKQMFEVGLVSQSDIDDIVFEIEQLNYDKMTLLIDGLSIELDIAKLNL